MFKKGTKLYSIFNNKCPRCHEGDFYVKPGFFVLKNGLKMHENCTHCGLKYTIEPSFFYGAMYVSYALTVAIAIATFIIGYWIGTGLLYRFIAIFVMLIILTPVTLRLSRLIYINFFIHFDKSKLQK